MSSRTHDTTAQAQSSRSDGVDEYALRRIAKLIKSGKASNIVVLTGAGISTSAGIPDFRSPETGLYANLARLNLPRPEAVFELDYFKRRPEPFWTLAKDLYPGKFLPTPTHHFLHLLNTHSHLLRIFTQNIDTLETIAGVTPSRVVEAHGSFSNAHCVNCGRAYEREYVLQAGVREGKIVRCVGYDRGSGRQGGKGKKSQKGECGGLVKPDIVFFGEGLPDRFFDRLEDLSNADLVLIIGTSLQVGPFNQLPHMAPSDCPRVLINREAVGGFERVEWARRERLARRRKAQAKEKDQTSTLARGGSGLAGLVGKMQIGEESKAQRTGRDSSAEEEDEVEDVEDEDEDDEDDVGRDAFFKGDADDAIWRLAEMLGWTDELEERIRSVEIALRKEWALEKRSEEESVGSARETGDSADAQREGKAIEKDAEQEVGKLVGQVRETLGVPSDADTAGPVASGRGSSGGVEEEKGGDDDEGGSEEDSDTVPEDVVGSMSQFLRSEISKTRGEA